MLSRESIDATADVFVDYVSRHSDGVLRLFQSLHPDGLKVARGFVKEVVGARYFIPFAGLQNTDGFRRADLRIDDLLEASYRYVELGKEPAAFTPVRSTKAICCVVAQHGLDVAAALRSGVNVASRDQVAVAVRGLHAVYEDHSRLRKANDALQGLIMQPALKKMKAFAPAP